MAETRRPGRPPLDENGPSVDVHVRVPASQYDEMFRLAQRERVSVPEVVRRALRDAGLEPKDGG